MSGDMMGEAINLMAWSGESVPAERGTVPEGRLPEGELNESFR